MTMHVNSASKVYKKCGKLLCMRQVFSENSIYIQIIQKMKKQRTKKWVRTLAILWCVGALAACNSERQTTGETTSSDDIEFAFVQESFGSEHAVTRSVRVTDTLADTLDLGGGLSAEISVATDTATIAPTRAPLSDGAYTIVVADAATHLPIAGKKLTGTVTGGTFKADNVLQIAAGTYDFVCFSEGVAEENGQLVVKNGAKSPMIGVVKGVVLSGRKQKVSFAMKHCCGHRRASIAKLGCGKAHRRGV